MSETATTAPIKLYYFNFAGKGESIRLACSYGNIPFEDVRLSDDDFAALKESGKIPFGQLPIMELPDGRVVGQSASILRFVGKQTGLYPSDPVEAAIVDSLLDQEVDMLTGLSVSRYGPRMGFANLDPAYNAQVRKALNDEVLPRHLQYFENYLAKSTTGWIAGGEGPSIVEFKLVPRLTSMVVPGAHAGISSELLEPFPLLKAWIARFYDLPAIKAFYAK